MENIYTPYAGNDLGAVYSKEKTTFRLWAPTAENVKICLFKEGNDVEAFEISDMAASENGTWFFEKEGDWDKTYYTYLVTVDGVTRGSHAHKCLQQILICIHGSCKIRLNDGCEEQIVLLDKPYDGLYISNNMWREMFDFSPDAVLLVLASEVYDESDYIRDYDEFLKFSKK